MFALNEKYINVGSAFKSLKNKSATPLTPGLTPNNSCKNETKLYSNLNLGVRIIKRFGRWAAGIL